MSKLLLQIVVAGVVTLAAFFPLFGQGIKSDTQTVKSAEGLILVRNDKVQRFSFFVPGKNPVDKQMDDGSIQIVTDGGGLAAYFVKTSKFLDTKKTINRLKILDAHRGFDIAAEEKILQTKLQTASGAEFVQINDLTNTVFPKKVVPSLYWSYSPPGSDGVVLYQTMLLGDTVLMLRTVFPKTIKIEEVRGFFKKVLESVALLPVRK